MRIGHASAIEVSNGKMVQRPRAASGRIKYIWALLELSFISRSEKYQLKDFSLSDVKMPIDRMGTCWWLSSTK